MPSSTRILIVDPDDCAAAEYGKFFAARGWSVHRARCLSEAERLSSFGPFRAAIIDMRLPDGVGLDALNLLRESAAGTLGIMTTDSASLHTLIDPRGDDILDYLIKPVSEETLAGIAARVEAG